jgi:hypothetical protein
MPATWWHVGAGTSGGGEQILSAAGADGARRLHGVPRRTAGVDARAGPGGCATGSVHVLPDRRAGDAAGDSGGPRGSEARAGLRRIRRVARPRAGGRQQHARARRRLSRHGDLPEPLPNPGALRGRRRRGRGSPREPPAGLLLPARSRRSEVRAASPARRRAVGNAGAWGGATADALATVELVTAAGEERTPSRREIPFRYRASGLPGGSVVTQAAFALHTGRPGRSVAASRDTW